MYNLGNALSCVADPDVFCPDPDPSLNKIYINFFQQEISGPKVTFEPYL
jgi:hypothetical protein